MNRITYKDEYIASNPTWNQQFHIKKSKIKSENRIPIENK